MKHSTARMALVIGAVSALGPIAIDMYLPALPTLARDLRADAGQAELSLMSFFIGMTLGQLFYGPLSDRIGRRRPLLFGLGLFVIGSLICSATPSLGLLILARLLQGLGGGAGPAIGSAIIRDLYTGYEAARLQAARMLVIGVSPIVAPVVGAALIAAAPWRTIFWVSASLGVAIAVLVFTTLPETRLPEARAGTRLGASFSVYGRLILDKGLVLPVLVLGLAQGAFFAYLASSSFVFITMNHAAPGLYSLLFGLNAAGFIAVAQLAPQLMRRFGPEPLILGGTAVLAVGSCLLLGAVLLGYSATPVLSPLLFVSISGIGMVFGPSVVLALKEHGAVAGAASSLIGFLQGALGASGVGLAAALANGTAVPMSAIMAAYGVVGVAIALVVYNRRAAPVQVPVGG